MPHRFLVRLHRLTIFVRLYRLTLLVRLYGLAMFVIQYRFYLGPPALLVLILLLLQKALSAIACIDATHLWPP